MAHLNRKAHRISFIVFVQPLLQWHTKQLSRVVSINVDGITTILYNRFGTVQGFISFVYILQTYIEEVSKHAELQFYLRKCCIYYLQLPNAMVQKIRYRYAFNYCPQYN